MTSKITQKIPVLRKTIEVLKMAGVDIIDKRCPIYQQVIGKNSFFWKRTV